MSASTKYFQLKKDTQLQDQTLIEKNQETDTESFSTNNST